MSAIFSSSSSYIYNGTVNLSVVTYIIVFSVVVAMITALATDQSFLHNTNNEDSKYGLHMSISGATEA